MSEELKKLLALQKIDSSIDSLKKKLKNLAERDMYEEASLKLTKIQVDLTKELKEKEVKEKQVNKMEGEIKIIEEKLSHEGKKLYDGKTTNPKELMSIQAEIKALGSEKDKRENMYLEALEQMEVLNLTTEGLINDEAEVNNRVNKFKESLEKNEKTIEDSVKDLEDKRNKVVFTIDKDSLKLYLKLRDGKSGLAVAKVLDGICQGCNVEISTEEEDKMMYEDRIWRCEHCKRILVE